MISPLGHRPNLHLKYNQTRMIRSRNEQSIRHKILLCGLDSVCTSNSTSSVEVTWTKAESGICCQCKTPLSAKQQRHTTTLITANWSSTTHACDSKTAEAMTATKAATATSELMKRCKTTINNCNDNSNCNNNCNNNRSSSSNSNNSNNGNNRKVRTSPVS